MTYNDILEYMYKRGANLADVAVGRMMDEVETETGRFPSWDDIAPEWILEVCGLKGGKA